jgi:type IV fimbrial biogenesis protein FimT
MTLIELMIVISIIAVIVTLAVPSFSDYILTQRARGAAEGLISALQNTKAEAIKTNQITSIEFQPTTTGTEHASSSWCYGMSTSPTLACNCTTLANCADGSVVDGDDYPNVTIEFNGSNQRSFEPVLGGANGTQGTVLFRAGNNKNTGVVLGTIGRIRMCKPADSTISRYGDSPDC